MSMSPNPLFSLKNVVKAFFSIAPDLPGNKNLTLFFLDFLAKVILFLASDLASYVTSQVIPITGGMRM